MAKSDGLVVESFDMSHLYALRHGDYVSDGRTDHGLSELGWKQIMSQFDVIRKTIDGGSLYIVSSPAPRARMSAEILAKEFGVDDIDFESYLWSAEDGPEDSYYYNTDKDRLVKIVEDRRSKADGLIVVSHHGAVGDLSKAFMKGRGLKYVEHGTADKGDMHYVDVKCGENSLHYTK